MVQYDAGLRRKNQLTLPEPVAARLEARPGDRLLFELDQDHPLEARVRVLRRSYVGVLSGVFGAPEDVAAYLEEERASWGDDE